VTGGATGIGAELVRQLAAQGARVAFVDVDDAAGRQLWDEVVGRGDPEPEYLHCDVRDVPALRHAITSARTRLGPIRVLVSNAADDSRTRLEDVDQALWDDRMAVNVRPHFFAAQTVAPMMRGDGGGSIINLGSISAHIDLTDLAAYVTAKAGIEGLTRTLARELGKDGIRVNCIIPGWIMTQRQLDHWVTPDAVAAIERNQCLPQKLFPADVARLLLWLAADDSLACTGQNWIVDGGWM
jgi:D-xylose 1-dehydrogenase